MLYAIMPVERCIQCIFMQKNLAAIFNRSATLFSLGTPVYSINKTYLHTIIETLLKVESITHNPYHIHVLYFTLGNHFKVAI
jgi:hypothetical protein